MMTEEIKNKLDSMYNHWSTKCGAVGGILVTIGTIGYYGWVGVDKVATALKSDSRLTVHELAQKQSFSEVGCKIDKLDSKLDKTFETIDRKLDDTNTKLFELAKSFSRIEQKQEFERKVSASIR